MMRLHTIPVPNPVEFDGRLITSIRIRPPTSDDLAAARRLNVGRYVRGLRLVSQLTGLSTQTVSAILKSNDDVADQVEKFVLNHMS